MDEREEQEQEQEQKKIPTMEGVASIALLPNGSISGHFIHLLHSTCYGLHGTGCVGVGEQRKGNVVVVGSSRDIFKRRRAGSQAIVNNKSDEFTTMCDLVSRHGLGFDPPSFDEIKGTYLTEEVKLTREALEEHRAI
ncbi:hypothetical protein TSUD_285080 [Trifolium subterraneum]|uniref:Uncharacterized protein n=1 Tax=Trifolium subterraneum TaxID=3900 RepID=A0A2Z6NU67_TRISU|nr:hypothetical protein TSUD_285080 [Trifolium subterraneum]